MIPANVLDGAANLANDVARRGLRTGARAAGWLFELDMRRRIRGFARTQARLAGRYQLDAATPIRPYNDDTLAAVEAYAARHRDARFAYTSGSTKTPKKIAFTRQRLL